MDFSTRPISKGDALEIVRSSLLNFKKFASSQIERYGESVPFGAHVASTVERYEKDISDIEAEKKISFAEYYAFGAYVDYAADA